MDTFTITIIFIFISALIAVIIRKLKKDKCLKDFQDNIVVLEKVEGEEIKGKLNVFNTGMELIYIISYNSIQGVISHNTSLELIQSTSLLYKSEYNSIQVLVRYLDELSDKAKIDRQKDMKRTFQPSKIQRSFRKMNNFLKTIKDSLLEIVNLLGNQLGKRTAVGMLLSSQDKYINRVKNELYTSLDNSFEPLLENYIGYRVVIEFKNGEDLLKYSGILVRYTSEFIELFDVDYSSKGVNENSQKSDINSSGEITDNSSMEENIKKVDLIIPRRYGVVRGLLQENV